MNLYDLTQDVIHLFYPSVCQACGNELVGNESDICVGCITTLPPTGFCHQANNPVEQRFLSRIPIEQGASIYYFSKDSMLQSLLHALKYNGKESVGIKLGQLMGECLAQSTFCADIDRIIPVPLSAKKMRQRGYNQSECLARGMSAVLQIPCDPESVIRQKHTLSQTKMTVAERMANVNGAFACINPAGLTNQHILLVDDVMTTGATLESCARAILPVQGVRLSILTLAYAIDY
jgi:ComF family protein